MIEAARARAEIDQRSCTRSTYLPLKGELMSIPSLVGFDNGRSSAFHAGGGSRSSFPNVYLGSGIYFLYTWCCISLCCM